MNKFEYKLITGNSPIDLAHLVNEHLKDGYRLKGPPNVAITSSTLHYEVAVYIQAMTKEIIE